MPVLTELEKRIDSTPPDESPKENNGDSNPGRRYMVLIGVEKNQYKEIKELADKAEACGCHFSDDLFKYNFAVLTGILEKYPASSVLGLEYTDYLFLDKDNSPHARSFEYDFLSNINGKWYACLLRDEKIVLEKIKANKEIIKAKEESIDELFAEFKLLASEVRGIKCTGNPLVFAQSYLGESPIKVYCEDFPSLILEKTRDACSPNKTYAGKHAGEDMEKHVNYWFFEERMYIAERFMPFENEFSKFIILNKEDLPKEISSYHLMSINGKEMMPSHSFFFWKTK